MKRLLTAPWWSRLEKEKAAYYIKANSTDTPLPNRLQHNFGRETSAPGPNRDKN